MSTDKFKDKKYQKGERRQKLHQNQNNVGNDKNPSEYKSTIASSTTLPIAMERQESEIIFSEPPSIIPK